MSNSCNMLSQLAGNLVSGSFRLLQHLRVFGWRDSEGTHPENRVTCQRKRREKQADVQKRQIQVCVSQIHCLRQIATTVHLDHVYLESKLSDLYSKIESNLWPKILVICRDNEIEFIPEIPTELHPSLQGSDQDAKKKLFLGEFIHYALCTLTELWCSDGIADSWMQLIDAPRMELLDLLTFLSGTYGQVYSQICFNALNDLFLSYVQNDPNGLFSALNSESIWTISNEVLHIYLVSKVLRLFFMRSFGHRFDCKRHILEGRINELSRDELKNLRVYGVIPGIRNECGVLVKERVVSTSEYLQ
jgi:hypothetical protein